MSKLRLAILLGGSLVAACGGHRGFYRDGATFQDFHNDMRQCEAETTPEWQFCSGQMCGQMQGEQLKRRNRCMMARGWIIRREEPKFMP